MVTMNDIAASAGVSQTTVSFVLNGKREGIQIAEETRQRVLDVARELGYRRNEFARAMVTGKSHVIGLVTGVGNSDVVMRIIEGALDEAAAQGYITKILRLPIDATPEQVHEVVQLCSTWRLDGVVAVGLSEDVLACLSQEIETNQRPVAYIETFPEGSAGIRIGSDDAGGMRAALTHLVGLGHRHIAFLGGPEQSSISQSRARLFLSSLKELGVLVREELILHSDWGHAGIIAGAAQRLLHVTPSPTAIFCMSDASAMVTMRLARKLGLALPEQLSVIGYGNASLATYADPSLTTIAQPFVDMGKIAVQRMLGHLKADRSNISGASSFDTPPQMLIVRGSTAPPAESPSSRPPP